MIKSLVAAAAVTIGLAGYAVAQEAAPAPAPTPPMTVRCITTIIITITIITTTISPHAAYAAHAAPALRGRRPPPPQ